MAARNKDHTSDSNKKKQKVITLDMKLEVIKRFKAGDSKTKIGKEHVCNKGKKL